MKRFFGAYEHLKAQLDQVRRFGSLRRELSDAIEQLSPWYQPIRLGLGLQTIAVNKHGDRCTVRSLDRGIRKWRTFVQPNLPFDLRGKRVLEVGCNAGLFLHTCVQAGVREAVGIEKDEHYYNQAQFIMDAFSRLNDRYYPVRVYPGSMEDFDYPMLGNFDLTLLLNVIYHIGKSDDYRDLNPEQVNQLQVKTLRNLASISRYLMFQAIRSDKDEGRGKGKDSLLALVHQAGLTVVKEAVYNHPRGYILLTKSENYQDQALFPIERMVSKYFLPAHLNAEREIVDLVLEQGADGFDITQTRYYQLRIGQADWQTPGAAHLPEGLAHPPQYWVVPWSVKPRSLAIDEADHARVRAFPGTYQTFIRLIHSLVGGDFDQQKGRIPGYKLVHPEYGEMFLYVNGNHRMGILSYLADHSSESGFQVPVEVRQVVERDKLLDYPLTQQLIEEGYFTESDVFKWFDNAYGVIQKVA